ncbi:MAG: TonB-dependent receptor [Candidatus Eisenbacteria bacterium]|uniref:TonB-dependent receptor n=1 Tax=Eiseniibacteriota bacterium TaxID=2212470 RepID=A0A849SM01_UNCEI|nr:TonB-dependent receptor [Candidatus Eisenbacteria bacterium]
MGRTAGRRCLARAHAWGFSLSLLLTGGLATASLAATGKIQGRVVAIDTGDPIGFADVLLVPRDTTLRRVGGITNADGTYLLEAAAGTYAIQIRALSYARKRIEGIVIEAGKLVPFSTALASEAIQQEEIVVEAKAKQNSEISMLTARRKSSSVGDAVSAEQVRKSPDKDAAEVLRRVTGLSVSDGKYVFVRGLGERYSSVEVDGVRLASPEENKRVVPLDLLPATLLENIVVQKTHTADRPGEFGGGDVQVRTKDFPGKRTWQFSVSQSVAEDVTFGTRKTYASSRADIFGFGADSRRIPDQVFAEVGDGKLFRGNVRQSTMAKLAGTFRGVWSPNGVRTLPNSSYSATYGDEFKLFGRPLGIIESWSLSRSYDRRDQSLLYFQNSLRDTIYAYDETKYEESVTLGGISGLSYRLSPRHALHLRGLYTQSADDEVRSYIGTDVNRLDFTERPIQHRDTRLLYVERNVMSGTLNGQHTLSGLLNAGIDWKLTRSSARRQQPDRREYAYDRNYYPDGNGNLVEYTSLGSVGSREFGDLNDQGWGGSLTASVPLRFGPLGNGKVMLGYDRQLKERTNRYRRFDFIPRGGVDTTLPPDSVFAYGGADSSGYVEESTLDVDNYDAEQRVTAQFVSVDLPFGKRLRTNFGVRVESGFQDVRTFDLFAPGVITRRGTLDNQDVLPSANLTWAASDAINLRLGASRTVSRPDLNELSPSPALEYAGGLRLAGNPDLQRATIDNYDVRVEAFPTLSEVIAAGFYYKAMHEPIERAIQGGAPALLVPRNSDSGRNLGVELELRAGLERLSKRLRGLTLNSNASFISSEIKLKPEVSRNGTTEHPLQGQANYLLNAAIGYAPKPGLELAVLFGATGERLHTLALDPLPDIYDQPTTSLDVTLSFTPFGSARMKASGRNLIHPEIQQRQGDQVVTSYRGHRSFSLALSFGS